MPKPNLTLAKLSEKAKEQYVDLMEMIGDDLEREKLEKIVHAISGLDALQNFIDKKFQNYIAYKDLVKLLPNSERGTFSKAFRMISHVDGVTQLETQLANEAKFIEQHAAQFQVIKNAPMLTQDHYIDLLAILPDDKAVALKNKIVHAINPDQVEQLIASVCPSPFKQLDDTGKENLAKLSDNQRQKILKKFYEVPVTQEGKDPSIVKEAQLNDTDSTTSADQLDIHKLLEQSIKEQEDEDEDIPQDKWGAKLPLRGEKRRGFLASISPFSQKDQKDLKSLFDQVDGESIESFLDAYFEEFDKNERIELLKKIILLYRKSPNLTVKLCNRPDLLGPFQYCYITLKIGAGISLLNRLQNYFS